MTRGISRRAMLRGVGQSAAIGSLAVALPRYLAAAQPAAPAAAPAKATICLSMLYPSGEGLKFDADKFRDHHLGVLKAAYAGALERVELRVSAVPAEGAPQPALLAAVSIWIRDVNKFIAGVSAHSKEVAADLATVTGSAPMVQFDQVVSALGADRDSVPLTASCISQFFPVKEGATWDAKGYADGYMAKVFEAYGPTAIRRIEIVKGAAGQGGKDPLFLGSAHLYIADEAAYDTATATDAVKQIAGEAAKYYSAPPFPSLMQVHAVG